MNVLVIGTESSGSVLTAKIVAHVLGTAHYGSWDGYGQRGNVTHKSLPTKGKFPKINESNYTHIVITTRDNNASVRSKMNRWGKRFKQARKENRKAVKILSSIKGNVMFFNYETLIMYGRRYAKELYSFLGVESNFIPKLKDGNEKYYA